jgi:hypothetical protein
VRKCEHPNSPAWSEILAWHGRFLRGNRRTPNWPAQKVRAGPQREGEEPKPMMHGSEKSDSSIRAKKSTNKPGQPGAESMEQREGTKEDTGESPASRTVCSPAFA